MNVVAVIIRANAQFFALFVISDKAAIQAVLVDIGMQHLKLFWRKNVNIFTVSASSESALCLNQPSLSPYGQNVVGIEQLLRAAVVVVHD